MISMLVSLANLAKMCALIVRKYYSIYNPSTQSPEHAEQSILLKLSQCILYICTVVCVALICPTILSNLSWQVFWNASQFYLVFISLTIVATGSFNLLQNQYLDILTINQPIQASMWILLFPAYSYLLMNCQLEHVGQYGL